MVGDRGRGSHRWLPPGGRGRSPAPRLPQNVACGFPALRSSEVVSQRRDRLHLRVREIQLGSIRHRSREVRQDLVVLRAREALVAARTELINATRGLVKSMGTRRPKCSSPSFGQKVKDAIPEKVREALLPLVQLADALSDCIRSYDQKMEELGSEKYGHTKLLRQVKGVGPITALAYVLTLENPEHFAKSRDVGPYLGLVPKQEDSGDSQPQLGISKAGDTMVRKLL